MKSGSKGRNRPGRRINNKAWAWGPLAKVRALLTVKIADLDVCRLPELRRSVNQIRLKAWQALPVEETGRSASRAKALGCLVKYESSNQVERLAIFAGGGESGGFGLKSSQVQASGGRELNSENCVKSKT